MGQEQGDIRRRLSAAEAELVETNRFLDAIIENIPDMIFVKDAKTLLFERFNRAGEELLGWSRSELLGKTDHDFYPREQADFFHAKDKDTLARRELVDVPEEPIQTRRRGLRWLHTKKVPVLGADGEPRYLLGISEDITARKEIEERARRLEHELASLMHHAPFAIVSWGADGRVRSFNPAAAALFATSAEEVVGRGIETLVPTSERAAFRERQAQVLAGAALPPVVVYRRRGQGEIEVAEQLYAAPEAGERRLAAVYTDHGEKARLRRAAELLEAQRPVAPLGSRSLRMRALEETLELVARDSDARVLLLGETGVGKSWLARRIHARSGRADRPFFEINCASLGPQLVESELFGHERGAFTGADEQKLGLVEAAHGGTLFLDEIGELPLAAQANLLTFLDTRCFRRVGGTRALTADVRVLAATNSDLREAMSHGRFRKDLYYRLSVLPLEVPALRERPEDLPALVEEMLAELARASGRRASVHLHPEVLRAFATYPWPGNLRELRNVLERLLILRRGDVVRLGDLPADLVRPPAAPEPGMSLDAAERAHILEALAQAAGNRTRAAKILGISRSTLRRKLGQYALDP